MADDAFLKASVRALSVSLTHTDDPSVHKDYPLDGRRVSEALELICDTPVSPEWLGNVTRCLYHPGDFDKRWNLRTDIALSCDENSGRLIILQHADAEHGGVRNHLQTILSDMGDMIRCGFDDNTSFPYFKIATIVGRFLWLHPFVDGNGRAAEIILTTLVNRLIDRRIIIHIGTRNGDSYKEWCAAVRNFHMGGSAARMAHLVESYVKEARINRDHF